MCEEVLSVTSLGRHSHVVEMKKKIDARLGVSSAASSASTSPAVSQPATPAPAPPLALVPAPAPPAAPAPAPAPPPPPPPPPAADAMDLDDEDHFYDPFSAIMPPSFLKADDLVTEGAIGEMGFAVSMEHQVLICVSCKFAVPTNKVDTHRQHSHGDRAKAADLLPLCDELGLPHQAHLPAGVNTPIPLLPILTGVFCTLCDFVTFQKHSAKKNHVSKVHKGREGPEILFPCSLQVVYKDGGVKMMRVDPNLAGEMVPLDVKAVLAELMEKDRKGRLTDVMVAPTVRQTSQFLGIFKWIELSDGRSYRDMKELVLVPHKKRGEGEEYWTLRKWVDKYFEDIQPIVRGMSALPLQWINTFKG